MRLSFVQWTMHYHHNYIYLYRQKWSVMRLMWPRRTVHNLLLIQMAWDKLADKLTLWNSLALSSIIHLQRRVGVTDGRSLQQNWVLQAKPPSYPPPLPLTAPPNLPGQDLPSFIQGPPSPFPSQPPPPSPPSPPSHPPNQLYGTIQNITTSYVDMHCHCTGDQVTAAAQFSPSPATPNRAPPHSFVDGHEDQTSVGSAGTPSHPHRYDSHYCLHPHPHVCGEICICVFIVHMSFLLSVFSWLNYRHACCVYHTWLPIPMFMHVCMYTSSHRVGEVVRTASNKYVSSVQSRYVHMTALTHYITPFE